jgi:hypothetical protein
VPLSAAALTLFLIFSMGLRIGGPSMAWIALVLVATMPVFVDYSRCISFAMGSTLATMAALYCLLRSDGMASLRWAILFGFCVGVMPLTRALLIAYVPGVLLAALISSLGRKDSRQRLARLAGATLLAAATTAAWFVPNWSEVWGYLIDFGYGDYSMESGAQISLLHWDSWDRTLRYYFDGAELIHSAILLVGITLTAVFAVRQLRRLESKEALRKVAHSGLLGPAVLFAVGTLALASTPNHGTGFHPPLLSALTLVSAWGLTRAHKYLQRAGVFLLTVAVLIVYVPDIDLRSPFAEYRAEVDIPGIGQSIITDGRGTLQKYEAWGIWVTDDDWSAPLTSPEPIDAATTREWQKVIAQTVEFIRRENQPSTKVAFGFRHILYNWNTLQLAQLSQYDHEMPSQAGLSASDGDRRGGGPNFGGIDPMPLGKYKDGYLVWLTNDGFPGRSCLLLTSAGNVNEIPPITDSEALTSAARRAHFRTIARWTLPDGRDVVAWRRDSEFCQKK